MIGKNFILLSLYNEDDLTVNVDDIIYINGYDTAYGCYYTKICIDIFGRPIIYNLNTSFFDIIKKIKELNNKAIRDFIYINSNSPNSNVLLRLSKIPAIKTEITVKDGKTNYEYMIIVSSEYNNEANIEFSSFLKINELILNNNNKIPNSNYEKCL